MNYYLTQDFTYIKFQNITLNNDKIIILKLSPYGSGVEHFLGKEEVVSSSLTMGSRINRPNDMDKCVVVVLFSCPYRLILT